MTARTSATQISLDFLTSLNEAASPNHSGTVSLIEIQCDMEKVTR
jgi:hypothetical protein